jgi:16S rRNA processing protein RimM
MVLVKSFTQDPAGLFSYPILNENGEKFALKFAGKIVKDCFLCQIEGVNTRDDVEKYRRVKLYVNKSHLPSLEEDNYYHIDLLGCKVKSIAGINLGEVKAIYNYGAGDILEIFDGFEYRMIPFHKEGVPSLDLIAKTIVVDDNFVCGKS